MLPKGIGRPPHSRHPSLKQLPAPGFRGRGVGGYGLLNLLGSQGGYREGMAPVAGQR